MTDTASLPDSSSLDIQGHRGARGLLPENTIPAFIRALDVGVTTLEMDVVISKDREVVVSHEPWFSAEICTDPDGRPVSAEDEQSHNLYALTYADISRYDCGVRGHARFPRQDAIAATKPLLRDVIRAAEAHRGDHGLSDFDYNIETKSRPEWDGHFHPDPTTFTRLLYEVVTKERVLERTTLQSFDIRTLQIARDMDPSWRLVLLVSAADDRGIDANLGALGFAPETYSPDYRLVDEALVERVHELGMKLIPWTVNSEADMQHLIGLGVDGIITDYPDIAVRVARR